MMKMMRDRVKLIYWVVIITFLGLTFLVWGIGLNGRKGKEPLTRKNAVATVNGHDITYDLYTQHVNSILDQMRQQQPEGEDLSENQRMRARQQAFDDLILETLEREEARKLGLDVTDEEIVDILSNNPPAFLLQQFVDENGKVDTEAYVRALQDPNLPWDQIESYIRSTVPLQKLENYVTGQALVSEEELRRAYAEQTVKAVAEYVGVELSSIELESEEVSDEEIRSFYEKHRDEYSVPEQVSVRLVTIPKEASPQDEKELVSILSDIRKDIIAGRTTFEEAAQTYSEDSSNASQGGDLGFIDRQRMVAPFTDAAFALKVGEISEPVKTQFGFHLIQVVEEKLDDKGKRSEVHVRHILLRRKASESTVEDLRDLAQRLHDEAEHMGLEAAADSAHLEVTTTATFQKTFNIPGVPNSLPGTRYAFDHEAGTLSPVFETQDMFYLFEVAEKIPAGYRPLEDVKAIVASRIQRERRADRAAAEVAKAWKDIQAGSSLADAAKKYGMKHAVTDTFTLRENIPGIGFATAFARAALSLEPGEMLPEVRTQRGVYLIKLLYKSPFDEKDFAAKRAALSQSLLFNRRRQILTQWQNQLLENAKIVDRRTSFL